MFGKVLNLKEETLQNFNWVDTSGVFGLIYWIFYMYKDRIASDFSGF